VTRTAPLTLGLIGCGRIAEAGYLPALAASGRFRLSAVADPDPRRTATVLRRADPAGGITCHAGAGELLERADVDAVIVAGPAATHLASAALAVAADVPVLVEKPPAPDADDARRLAQLTPRPWIGFNRRFDPGAAALRRRIDEAGEVDLELTIHYRRRSWSPVTVRDDALLDLGTHLVDWARWLTGAEVDEVVRAELGPERATVELCTSRGPTTLHARTNRVHRESIRVRDGQGRPIAVHRRGGTAAALVGRVRRRNHPGTLVDTLARQLEAFAAAVESGTHPVLATADDGLAAMLVLDAARRSDRGRGPVRVTAPVGGS
jgi:predicted dehydrogenase